MPIGWSVRVTHGNATLRLRHNAFCFPRPSHAEVIPKHKATSTAIVKTKDQQKLIIVKLIYVLLENESAGCSSNVSSKGSDVTLPRLRNLASKCRQMVELLYGGESRISWLRDKGSYHYLQDARSRLSSCRQLDRVLLDFLGKCQLRSFFHVEQGRIHGIRCVLARTDSRFGQKLLFCMVSTRV